MLANSAHIQESEVEQLNRRNQRRGRAAPCEPIYTAKDAARTMELFRRGEAGGRRSRSRQASPPAGGTPATSWARHRSKSTIEGEPPLRLLFSGDLGPGGRDFLADPQGSGGRRPPDHGIDLRRPRAAAADARTARRALLAAELRAAQAAGGPLLVPGIRRRTHPGTAGRPAAGDGRKGPRRPPTSSSTRRSPSRPPRSSSERGYSPNAGAQSFRGAARRRAPALSQEATGERPSGTPARLARDHGGQRHVRRGARAQAPETPALALVTRPCC